MFLILNIVNIQIKKNYFFSTHQNIEQETLACFLYGIGHWATLTCFMLWPIEMLADFRHAPFKIASDICENKILRRF